MRVLSLAMTVLLGVSMHGVSPATAGPPVRCAPGSIWKPVVGQCVIVVTPPSSPGDPGDPEQPDPVGGVSASPSAQPRCTDSVDNTEVACEREGGWHWVQGWNAYARPADPQPDRSNALWEGKTDGAIYEIGTFVGNVVGVGLSLPRWSATPPWVNVPDPRILAQQAIEQMNLQAVTIGIVPDDGPGSMGLVGLPTWMWAEAPGENTMGPITRSASASGYTVTATGRVDKVAWDMGDGATVTCTGAGKPYEDVYMDSDSPVCGHRYQDQGDHPVTATSYWAIDWSGMGQSGTISLQLQESTTIRIGEAQVLNTLP